LFVIEVYLLQFDNIELSVLFKIGEFFCKSLFSSVLTFRRQKKKKN